LPASKIAELSGVSRAAINQLLMNLILAHTVFAEKRRGAGGKTKEFFKQPLLYS